MNYYAVGNTPIKTGIYHGKMNFTKNRRHCSLFRRCPIVHAVNLTEKMVTANFTANETFALFRTKEEADAFSRMKMIVTKPENMKAGSPLIWDNYPVFTVECEKDNLEFKPANYYVSPTAAEKSRYAVYNYCTIARDEIKPVTAEYFNNNLDNKLTMDFAPHATRSTLQK